MPVRIVKDNPDETVVNEAFNFDNPSDQTTNNNNTKDQSGGGGGFDISSIVNLLGGGGQNQGNGGLIGGLANLLGGGGQQSGGLGGLVNLLGGGGRQRQSSNSLLSVLGSIAIQACIGYAKRRFAGGSRGSGLSQSGAPSPNDLEALLQERYASARLCVSLWSHVCGADRQFHEAEKTAFYGLIDQTSRDLFPDGIAKLDEVKSEMIEAFNHPIAYEEIVGQASADQNFATELFKQACFLAAVDKQLARTEVDFIGRLAQDLQIDDHQAQTIRAQFGL